MEFSRKKLAIIAVVFVIIIAAVASLNLKNPKDINVLNPLKGASDFEEGGGSGNVKIETMRPGFGEKNVRNGDFVLVYYVGTLADGTVFDSAFEKTQAFGNYVGKAKIKGWDEGLLGMKIGEKRRLTVPPELGYGNIKSGNIPANSTLIFEVELLDIRR